MFTLSNTFLTIFVNQPYTSTNYTLNDLIFNFKNMKVVEMCV